MRPELEKILSATLEVERMERWYYDKWAKSRIAPVSQVKRLVCYVGRKHGYTQRELSSFLHCSMSTVACIKKRMEELASIYREEKEKITKIEAILSMCEMCGYVARDKEDEGLMFSLGKPRLVEGMWIADGLQMRLPIDSFPQVTYSNSPLSCEMTLRLK